MKRSIFKPILFGILFGAAAYFAPFFLIKGILFFMIIGFIFRMIWWRGYRWGSHMRYQVIMADRIRSMSDEEYNALKEKFNSFGNHGHACYGGRWGGNWRDKNDWCRKEESQSQATTSENEKK